MSLLEALNCGDLLLSDLNGGRRCQSAACPSSWPDSIAPDTQTDGPDRPETLLRGLLGLPLRERSVPCVLGCVESPDACESSRHRYPLCPLGTDGIGKPVVVTRADNPLSANAAGLRWSASCVVRDRLKRTMCGREMYFHRSEEDTLWHVSPSAATPVRTRGVKCPRRRGKRR